MRFWRIAALLLAAMVVPTAAAEMEIQLDLDTATLDELIVARDAISARIEEIESEMAGEVLPAGTYLAGRDILPGVYVLRESERALLPSFTLRDGETGDTLEFEIINCQSVVELLERAGNAAGGSERLSHRARAGGGSFRANGAGRGRLLGGPADSGRAIPRLPRGKRDFCLLFDL